MPLLPAAFSRHVIIPLALYFQATTTASDASVELLLHWTLACCVGGAGWVSGGMLNHSDPRVVCWVVGRKVNHVVPRVRRVYRGDVNHSV